MRSGFFGRVGFGERPALVIVDVSVGFTDPDSPSACDLDAVVAAIKRALEAARAAEIPVVFTTVSYSKADEQTARAFLDKAPALRALEAGSRWVQIDPRIEPLPHEPVLVKLFASASFGTSLISLLTAAKVDTVIVMGAATSGCVRATAVDALQNGFRPVVAREAVGDRNRTAHDANLFDMDAKYADVISVKEVINYLEGR